MREMLEALGMLQVEVKWEWRDAWVGLFWDHRKGAWGVYEWHIFLCPLPFCLIHVWWPE